MNAVTFAAIIGGGGNMLLRCDHIHLIAEDIERTVAWYCRVFGAKVTFRGEFRGSPVRYLGAPDRIRIELSERK